MLTLFGQTLRKIRIDHNEVMLDMAKVLGVTSSYLSAVETGKREAPAEWPKIIGMHYRLSKEEIQELVDQADLSRSTVKINIAAMKDKEKRDLALAFARRIENLDSETVRSIRKKLK